MSKIILDDRMYVDKSIIPLKAIKSRYELALYEEKTCLKCENLEYRSPTNELCKGCPAFYAAYRLYKETSKYWSLPQGDFPALKKLLDKKNIDFKLIDKRPDVPFKFPIKFTGKLFGEGHVDENGIPRVNQKQLVKKYLKVKNGIIRAKPRSGKTIMSAYICCKIGQKTVILANRKELIKQFYNTFMGTKTRPAMSNIPELQEKTGKEIIRIAQKPSDLTNLKDVDILLINYQKLVRKPKRMAKVVNGKFGHLIVDEAHGSAADGYLKVISNCSVKYRLALTATPRRKDNRHTLVYRIMGPVAVSSAFSSLVPKIEWFQSKVTPPRAYKIYHHAMNWISSNLHLQKEVVKQAFTDLRAGHEVIIIPLDRKKHIDTLVRMLNKQAEYNNENKNENWPKKLAITYYDGVNRDKVLQKVDKPGPTILVAMRSMIKEGIDFIRPSMLYAYIPMSASSDKKTGAPLFEQLSNRVCTPSKKPSPVVRVWVHNIGMMQGAVRGLGWQELAPNKYNERTRQGKYILDQDFFDTLKGMNTKKISNSKKNFDWV